MPYYYTKMAEERGRKRKANTVADDGEEAPAGDGASNVVVSHLTLGEFQVEIYYYYYLLSYFASGSRHWRIACGACATNFVVGRCTWS